MTPEIDMDEVAQTAIREQAKFERLDRFNRLLTAAKLCRSYFFEDPNRAYEILADALRELEA